MNEVHFSSSDEEWGTPDYLFDYYNALYGFTLDPCASDKTHLCSKYYTKEDDGLSKSWAGERVFMNPPYGKQITKWLKKAYEESRNANTIVVCVIPARTETKWFWEYCWRGEVTFLQKRVRFIHDDPKKDSPPFPSCIVKFAPFIARQAPEDLHKEMLLLKPKKKGKARSVIESTLDKLGVQ